MGEKVKKESRKGAKGMIRHKSAIVPSGPLEAVNCTDFCAEVGRAAISRYKWSYGPNIDENLSVTLGPDCLMYLKQPKKGENGANGAYVRYVRYACFCLIPRVFGRGFTLGTFRARDLILVSLGTKLHDGPKD